MALTTLLTKSRPVWRRHRGVMAVWLAQCAATLAMLVGVLRGDRWAGLALAVACVLALVHQRLVARFVSRDPP